MNKKQKRWLKRILIALAIFFAVMLAEETGLLAAVFGDPGALYASFALYLIPYLIAGHDVLRKAWRNIRRGEAFDENFLISVATIGAFAMVFFPGADPHMAEGAAVMLFYQVGELFQSYAVGKSRKSIAAMMDIAPDYANIEQNGALVQVDPDEVAPGSVIVVKPGERIPIDGVVTEGTSELDTAALTGESMPRHAQMGDEVISGCINMTGVLRVRTTKPFGASTVSRILELVENASEKKARTENFITRFARVYTPIVTLAALALAVIPPLAGMGAWQDWILRGLTFLVVSCPCALVISVPLSFFGGIGGASKLGILVKGSNYLEALAQVDTVVFDKTGTLTSGTFDVVEVTAIPQVLNASAMAEGAETARVAAEPEPTGIEAPDSTLLEASSAAKSRARAPHNAAENLVLEFAAHAEALSDHPIAASVRRAYEAAGGVIDQARVSDAHEKAGHGVAATIDGHAVLVGNGKLMKAHGIDCPASGGAGTILHVAVDGAYAGSITIADTVKDDAARAIEELHRAGVEHCVMLTGDRADVAHAVGSQLGIDEIKAELLPQDKVSKVEELLQASRGNLAFVGDGINDAPVLTRADVGIAMGAMGSDAAIEAADVVLMDDKPSNIARAIRLARRTMRIVWQNIVFAIGVKVLILALAALGVAGMWLAVFGDVGVAVIAILNAMRAMRVERV
ncbi:MAG: HAD-IC family P-type ATPase [Coriobacteriaceae bacterium]|nr:HAD-IC family P-type ATPase [Coriobacteriaceae bacterium]